MSSVVCQCCGKRPTTELISYKSKLMLGFPLIMCQPCINSKYEPRFLVILFARKNGFDSVRDYIKKRRYYGDEIKASDVIV
jgi:hypothetical protein